MRRLLLAACALLLCGATFKIDRQLYFRAATFDPRFDPSAIPQDAIFRSAGLLSSGVQHAYVVQFKAPLSEADRAYLGDRFGLDLAFFVPNDGYIEIVGANKVGSLADDPLVRAVIPYRGALKIDPALNLRPPAPGLLLSLTLFPELSVEPIVAVLEGGGTLVDITDDTARGGVRRALVWVSDESFIPRLADLEVVQWVAEQPVRESANATTTRVVQSGNNADTPVWDRGLHGEGQIIGLIDEPIDDGSCFLSGKPVNQRNDGGNKPLGHHGNHVAGILCGDDVNASGTSAHRGHAWKARLTFGNLGDIYPRMKGRRTFLEYLDLARLDDAHVHNNSWISSRKSIYNDDAYDLDLFTTKNEDELVVVAANDKGAPPYPVGSPGDARNGITVGASAQHPDHLTVGLNVAGPTADLRRKPEVLAPGIDIVSAYNSVPQQRCRTGALTGTSMAAPAITAAAALVRQYFLEGWWPTGRKHAPDRKDPSAALVKAVLLSAAQDMHEAGYGGDAEGFGFPVLEQALFFASDPLGLEVWDVRNAAGLAKGDEATHTVKIANGQPLRVTLVWTDPANSIAADPRIANDLNLSVTAGGSIFLGNVFSPSGSAQSSTGGSFDLLNNVEMVVLPAPPAGVVEIVVSRRNLGRTGTQGYALVVTGAIVR